MEKNVHSLKVGSKVLTDGSGTIKVPNILSICQQVVKLMEIGRMAFIVSSGAIASEPDKSLSKNLRSLIGQPDLMLQYKRFFSVYGIKCGQLLLTDRDFESGIVRDVLIESFKRKVVLILNANDGVDNEELGYLEQCADNDHLLKKAVLSVSDHVISSVIGFEEAGVIDNAGNILHVARRENREEILSYAKGSNELGHGDQGAYTKFSVAFDLAEAGVPTAVVPSYEPGFFLRGIRRVNNLEEVQFGTLFV